MIALVSMIKDENLYLKEWIDYHLNIGVDYIFLFEDWDSKSHANITNKYPNVFLKSVLEIFNNDISRKIIQTKVANYFLDNYKNDFDWIGFIDIDEYITINDETLRKSLGQFQDKASILLKWINYNANGHFYRPEGGIQENYIQECGSFPTDGRKWIYKAIVNTKYPNKWINQHYTESYVMQDSLYIRHYVTKSFEDYCYRIFERGDVLSRQYRNYDMFFLLNPEFNREECNKFVEERYGGKFEYPEHESPNKLGFSNTPTIKRNEINLTFGKNFELRRLNKIINGEVQIEDKYNIIGGCELNEGILNIFVHRSNHSNSQSCTIKIVADTGEYDQINIQQEGNDIQFIIQENTMKILPSLEGFKDIYYTSATDFEFPKIITPKEYYIEIFKSFIRVHFKRCYRNDIININDYKLEIIRE